MIFIGSPAPKVLSGSLTHISAWVVFWTSSPQQGVKYQLWYLDFWGNPMNIQSKKESKVLSHLRLNSLLPPQNSSPRSGGESFLREIWFEMSDLFSYLLIFTIIKTILRTFVLLCLVNLVKWALTEMLCSVAGTTTLDRECSLVVARNWSLSWAWWLLPFLTIWATRRVSY